MRPLELREKKRLYSFTKANLLVGGGALIVYGAWYLVSGYIISPDRPGYWLGLLPAYLGSMMILLSLAMKLEWFTDARRFW